MTPTPVDELPSFIAQNNNSMESGSNQWSKYIIVGSIIVISIGLSIAIMAKTQENHIITKPETDENKNT